MKTGEAAADATAHQRELTEEMAKVQDALDNFHWSVTLDSNLLHIDVNPGPGRFWRGTELTIIMPHIRGVGSVYLRHECGNFAVFMHQNQEPLVISSGDITPSGLRLNTAKRAANQGIIKKMALVRHDVLAAINEYHTREYIGHQFKLKL